MSSTNVSQLRPSSARSSGSAKNQPRLSSASSTKSTNREPDFFDDFVIENAEGLPIELRRYRGRVAIVTNVASFASNSKSELEALNALAHRFGENLIIIGVPCNHFHHEPSEDTTETLRTMEYVRPGNGFRPDPTSFIFTTHANCNGADQLPLLKFLKRCLPLPADDQFSFGPDTFNPVNVTWSPLDRSDVASKFFIQL